MNKKFDVYSIFVIDQAKNQYYIIRNEFDCCDQEILNEAYKTFLFVNHPKRNNATYYEISQEKGISSKKMRLLALRSYLDCVQSYFQGLNRK